MENPFEMIKVSEGREIRLRLGIRINLANQTSVCPISKVYQTPQEIADDLAGLAADLQQLASKARRLFQGEEDTGDDQVLAADMSSARIWQVLSAMEDESRFFGLFNQLKEEKRREVAEYILTQCNVFTGKGAVFSAHYNDVTACLAEA